MRFVLITFMAATLLAEADKKAPAAPKSDVPSTAVKLDDGSYRFVDAKGKAWIYRNTPFGWSKAEERATQKAAEKPAPEAKPAPITAVEEGDIVRFERPSPFGPYKWQKKKSDLTPEEKAALEQSKSKAASVK